jgi:predicted RND superfamily exporter protein
MKFEKIEYNKTDLFKKDFKQLLKRYKTLEEDLENVKRDVIELCHIKKINNESIILAQGFCSDKIKIYIIKKIACKSLKGRGVKSGIRIVYAFYCQDSKVDFIEIYFKGDKEIEDKKRIEEYLKNH